jgi:P4 family phage/plasmid primase-like protien
MTDPCDVYKTFATPGDVVEIRALGVSGKSTHWSGYAREVVSGYFDDPDTFGAAAKALDAAGARGVYFTLNPCLPPLLARSANRLRAAGGKDCPTTSDKEIAAVRWLPVDVDPVRPAGVSSSHDELTVAKVLAAKIKVHLMAAGWPAPIIAASGNGYHLLWRLPDGLEEPAATVKACLEALAAQFSTPAVKVDTVNHNPARIWKLYGTTARKGDATADRPHRRAQLLSTDTAALTVEQILWLAAQAPQPEPSKPAADTYTNPRKDKAAKRVLGSLDVSAYLNAQGVAYDLKVSGDKRLYRLEQCLFDASHRNESAIVQDSTGKVTYQCFHESCRSHTWAEARRIISGDESLARWCEGYDPAWRGEKKRRRREPLPPPVPVSEETPFLLQGRRGVSVSIPALVEHLAKLYAPIYNEGPDHGNQFYRYDDASGVWRLFSAGALRYEIFHLLAGEARFNVIEEACKLLAIKTYRPPEVTTPDPMYLNLRNGMLSLHSRELLPHDPKYYSRVQLPVSYRLDADYSRWVEVLAQIFADNLEKEFVLKQFFGYCLFPKILFPCAVFAVGGGGNGKGTVDRVLCAMLGDSNVSHISLSRMEDRFGAVELKDKLLNTCGETDTGVIDVTKFKGITAGDAIQAEVKYAGDCTFVPIAKHLISMNAMPNIREKTDSFFRRVVVLEFLQKFDGQATACDVALSDTLIAQQLDGVFMWALEGLESVLTYKRLLLPHCCQLSESRLRSHINPLLLYVEEGCVFGPDCGVYPEELFRNYCDWCKASGVKPLGKIKFYEQMKLQFGSKVSRERRRINGELDTRERFAGIGISASPAWSTGQSS